MVRCLMVQGVHYYLVDRITKSILSSTKTKCSKLKYHLFSLNLAESSLCSCGQPETEYHYFFECRNYIAERNEFFMQTLFIPHLSLSVILHGNSDFSSCQLNLLFSAVTKFIKSSKRIS